MELTNLIYTHSEYWDVLDIFLKQAHKFGMKNIVIASDKKYDGHECLIYDNNLSYSERLTEVLGQVSTERVFYCHEDHILYNRPDWDKIFHLSQLDCDFVRIAKTGNLILKETSDENIYEISGKSQDFFAVQPSVWNVNSFIGFLKKSGANTIWELETKGKSFSSEITGCLYFEETETGRGGHFDSNIFPCILTAICKGRWNFTEYKKELLEIFAEYKIQSTRNTC